MPKSQIYIIDISNIFSAYQNVERIKLLLESLNGLGLGSGSHAANMALLTEQYKHLHMLVQELINTPLILENMLPTNESPVGKLFNQFIAVRNDFDKTRRGLLNELNKSGLNNDNDRKAASDLENYYFEPLSDLKGACSGLGAWWGYAMSEKNESVFYGITDEISQCLDSDNRINLDEMQKHKMALMKYNAHISWLQEPSRIVEGIEQNDLSFITDVLKLEYIFNRYNNIRLNVRDEKKIVKMLSILPENRIIHIAEAGHGVDIYKRGNEFFYFDSNDESGRAIQTKDPNLIPQWLNNSYSQSQWFGGDLQMNVFVNPNNETTVTNEARFRWLLFLSSCNDNRKDSVLQTAARCVGTMNLELLCSAANTNDLEKLSAIINKEKLLSIAFECKNYQFIKSMIDIEGMTSGKLVIQGKLELLNQIYEDYLSTSAFHAGINLKPAEDLIRHVLKYSDDLTVNKFLHSLLQQVGATEVSMQYKAEEAKLILTLLASHDERLKNTLAVIAGINSTSEAKLFIEPSPTVAAAREILTNISSNKTIKPIPH